MELNDTPKPTSAQLANKLKQLLVRAQCEANRLSHKEVRPNLHRLWSSLDNSLSLAMDLVCRKRLKSELAEILKEDLQMMCAIAVKLHVPNGKREKAAYCGLSRVRRQLNTAASLATHLHTQMQNEATHVCKPGDIPCVEEDHKTNITNMNGSTYWKPSLNTSFFLKPSTLVSKPLTEKQEQSLAEALAIGEQLNDNDIGEDNKIRISSVNSSTYWKPSLNTSFFLKPSTLVPKPLANRQIQSLAEVLAIGEDVLPPTVEKFVYSGNQGEASNACKPNHLSCTREGHKSSVNSSTYWKPSMNTLFFLKPSTLVPNPLTERQVQSLAEALAIEEPHNDSKVEDHPHCDKEHQVILLTTAEKPIKLKKCTASTEKANTGHWKPSLNTQFFLKEPTLIHTSLTAKHIKNLVKMLKNTAQPTTTKTQDNEEHKKDEKHVFIRASVDLQSVLSQACKKSEPAKRTINLPMLIKAAKKSAVSILTKEAVLDDVVDVGLVKKRHLPTKTTCVFQTLKSTKISSTFKPPKGMLSKRIQLLRTKTGKEVTEYVTSLLKLI